MVHDDAARRRRKNDLLTTGIAGAAGLALLAGGTTFALWSDSDTIGGATIASGSLSVEAEALSWSNTTGTGAPVPIADIEDPADFTAASGSSVRGVSNVAIELEGSGISADLSIEGASLGGNDIAEGTVYVFEPGEWAPGVGFDPAEAAIASQALGSGAVSIPLNDLDASDSGDWTVVVMLDFGDGSGSSNGDPVELGDIALELTQQS